VFVIPKQNDENAFAVLFSLTTANYLIGMRISFVCLTVCTTARKFLEEMWMHTAKFLGSNKLKKHVNDKSFKQWVSRHFRVRSDSVGHKHLLVKYL